MEGRERAAAGVDSGDELEDETGAAVKEETANAGSGACHTGCKALRKKQRQDAKPIFRNWHRWNTVWRRVPRLGLRVRGLQGR